MEHLAVQLIVAILCAGIANILIPHRIPGRFLGLMLTGLTGVWLGEVVFKFLKDQYGVSSDILHWGILGVPLIPSVIGSVIELYLVTTFFGWRRYTG
ncbi:hypothetical protein [Leptothermofonsia sp. ETS-13]|uniref:hypothetical protein n=1 Tax=Leptothermofonsia sp. ETS-13 TaxID=3035696 RepID=UPI003B9E1195